MKKHVPLTEQEKRNRFLLALVVGALILIIVGLFLGKGNDIKQFQSSIHYQDYQVFLEAKVGDNTILEGVYAYKKEQDIMYFRLLDDEKDLEQQFYDRKSNKLYYQNTTTGMYQEMDYETDYSMNEFLRTSLCDSKGNLRYQIPSEVILSLYQNTDNIMLSYLKQLGYVPNGKSGSAEISYVSSYFDTITYTIPTEKGNVLLQLHFQTEPKEITLPVENITHEEEKRSAQWIILFIQRVYATEPQEAKAITDIQYLMQSSYASELQTKLSLMPTDIRLRINPSTSKESGIISGTITFENGVSISIEKNVIQGD